MQMPKTDIDADTDTTHKQYTTTISSTSAVGIVTGGNDPTPPGPPIYTAVINAYGHARAMSYATADRYAAHRH
jgi:hypothetical protein